MKVGKVSETILKRSIFKQIHTKRDEVLLGAGVGEDCAAMKLAPGEIFVISTDPIDVYKRQGLATPVAIMVGNGMGAKNGIMFKTAASLEATGKTQIVALDKTGTITSGEPKTTDILPAEGVQEAELLKLAYTLERKSEHPLARAILETGRERGADDTLEVADFQAVPGGGLTGTLDGTVLTLSLIHI